jgi:DNA helicase-2/ATP-dependent DNA helicase PcrA
MKDRQKSKILEDLNDEQKQAVTHGPGPVLIVAGAGTGKTTVITRRVAYLIEQGVKPEQILALAFGDKAAAEMEERVDQLLPYGYYNLQISTFHSFGEQILREWGLEIGLPDFQVANEVRQWVLVRNNLEKFDLDYYRPLGNPSRFVRALVSHFARAKDELISPEEYLNYAEKIKLGKGSGESGLGPAEEETRQVIEVANAYHVYQKLLLDNNLLDFGDLINYSLELFKKRPKILEIFRSRFKYVLIDEFQDTNFAQYELIKLLAEPKNNLTVVGDDDQSIYKFRGASISNILHFREDYPQAKFINLLQNYRNRQLILDKAHEFIKLNDPDRLEVKLGLPKKLKSQKPKGGAIEQILARDYLEEAELVIEKILRLKKENQELTWNDFAILARSHDALEPFLNKLEFYGLPFIYFANKGLYRKPIILDILAYFRLLDNYHESSALYRVLRFPFFAIKNEALIELSHYASKKALSLYEAAKQAAVLKIDEQSLEGINKFLNSLEKHAQAARTKTAAQVFVEIVNDLDFKKRLNSQSFEGLQNAKYLDGLLRRIQDFQNESQDKTLKSFFQELSWELVAGEWGSLEVDTEAGPEAVKVMTVHGAKGLEFTYVFVVGLVDKRFPTIERGEQIEIPQALIKDILPIGDIHLEEERRLFYVALTRAKEGLYLTRARDYGGKQMKKPSRFLQELGLASGEESFATGKVEFLVQSTAKQTLPIPKHFSFSQISVFRKCPLEYKYRYILKIPVAGSASLSFGATIHKTLEKYLRLFKQSATHQDLFGKSQKIKLPQLEKLEKLYEESWIDEWYESRSQLNEYKKLGYAILKNFYEYSLKNLPNPEYLEKNFRLRLGNSWILGKIDRADSQKEGLLIIDYKTGEARAKLSPVDKQQLLLYQWAAEDYLGEKVSGLQYWYLKGKLEAETFLGSKQDLLELRENFEDTIKKIKDATLSDGFAALDHRVSHECGYRDLEK